MAWKFFTKEGAEKQLAASNGGTAGQILGINATGALVYMGGAQLICDSVLGGAQAAFDTNAILGGNIPQGFKHLLIDFQFRSSLVATADTASLQFNGDTTANYNRELMIADTNAATSSTLSTAQTSGAVALIPAASSPANYTATGTIWIPNYSGTAFFKNAWCDFHAPYNLPTASRTGRYAWDWASTNAITRINIFNGANFVTGSRFSLYGLS